MSGQLEQEHAYDCGPACVRYLLTMRGWTVPRYEYMLRWAETTAEHGTSHAGMSALIIALGFKPAEREGRIRDVPLFSIVNYQSENDGHYGVVVAQVERHYTCREKKSLQHPIEIGYVSIWSPSDGDVYRFGWDDFDSRLFYSTRYGRNWSISME